MKKIYILFTSILITGIIAAQHTSLYMPPSFKRAYEKGTRSWDGKPGPNYWQNSSKYKIWAEYDPATKFIIGKEEVVYSNNSPDTIMYFVTKLLQNAYKKGNAKDYEVDPDLLTDGIEIGKFVINGTTYYEDNEPVLNGKPPFFIQLFGTNLLIILRDNPIMPGDQLKIEAEWKVELPERSLYRTGHYDSTSFFAGYWYPQIAYYSGPVRL